MSLKDFNLGFSIPDQFMEQYQTAIAKADLMTVRSILMSVCSEEDRAKVVSLLPDDLIAPAGYC